MHGVGFEIGNPGDFGNGDAYKHGVVSFECEIDDPREVLKFQ